MNIVRTSLQKVQQTNTNNIDNDSEYPNDRLEYHLQKVLDKIFQFLISARVLVAQHNLFLEDYKFSREGEGEKAATTSEPNNNSREEIVARRNAIIGQVPKRVKVGDVLAVTKDNARALSVEKNGN